MACRSQILSIRWLKSCEPDDKLGAKQQRNIWLMSHMTRSDHRDRQVFWDKQEAKETVMCHCMIDPNEYLLQGAFYMILTR